VTREGFVFLRLQDDRRLFVAGEPQDESRQIICIAGGRRRADARASSSSLVMERD